MRSPSLTKKNVSTSDSNAPVTTSTASVAPVSSPRVSAREFVDASWRARSSSSESCVSERCSGPVRSQRCTSSRPAATWSRRVPISGSICGARAALAAAITSTAPPITAQVAASGGQPRARSQPAGGASSVDRNSATITGRTTSRR
jgi:hypothetical protein